MVLNPFMEYFSGAPFSVYEICIEVMLYANFHVKMKYSFKKIYCFYVTNESHKTLDNHSLVHLPIPVCWRIY